MNVLHIGDVVGDSGTSFLQKKLPALKRRYAIDMTIVNGENSAQWNGVTNETMQNIFSAGADVITTGNHCFKHRESLAIYENPFMLRPLNYPEGCTGKGCCIVDFGAWRAAVINLAGTAYLEPIDNPFTVIDTFLDDIDTPNVFVDFHAESTAEKKAMGFFLAGRVTSVVGTHTHVQTADETILADHTGYLTDVGMTGPEESILGVAIDPALQRFRFHESARFTESDSAPFLNGVVISFDEKCGKCQKMERVVLR